MQQAIYPSMVKELRERMRETQEGFARLLDVSTSTVSKWEAGAARPTGDRALAILRLRGEAPQPVRQSLVVSSTIATYDHAIATWEGERNACIRAGESTRLADATLRLLRNTRDQLLRESTDD